MILKSWRKFLMVSRRMLVFLLRVIFDLPHTLLKIGRKLLVVLKNPKIFFLSVVHLLKKTKLFCRRLPRLTREYFFWMVMSAENNVERLKRKNVSDIPSFGEIKIFQKKLRRKTFNFVSLGMLTVMLVILLSGVFQKYSAQSKGYQWIQTDWSLGISALTTNALTGWKYYSAKNPVPTAIDAGVGSVTLHNFTAANVTETTGTYSGLAGATGSKMYALGNTLKLKKPFGAACGSAGDSIGDAECAGGACDTTNTCCIDPCCSITSVSRTDNGSTLTYNTVIGADNKCWLDRNLGSTKVAASYSDVAARGWLFQWGRRPDGHQIIGSTQVVATSSLSNSDIVASPNDVKFITSDIINLDWRNPQSPNAANLWGGTRNNNPCPDGFRVPTQPEWVSIISAAGISNKDTAFGNSLRLVADGFRSNNGQWMYAGATGMYWTSSNLAIQSYAVTFTTGVYPANNQDRSMGGSVRCIKN